MISEEQARMMMCDCGVHDIWHEQILSRWKQWGYVSDVENAVLGEVEPTRGNIYLLDNFTAPKFFNGLYYECLLTDQKIPANKKIVKDLGSILDYKGDIFEPERFKRL